MSREFARWPIGRRNGRPGWPTPAASADRFGLPADQREALVTLDVPRLVGMGAHPLVAFLANMQVACLHKADDASA